MQPSQKSTPSSTTNSNHTRPHTSYSPITQKSKATNSRTTHQELCAKPKLTNLHPKTTIHQYQPEPTNSIFNRTSPTCCISKSTLYHPLLTPTALRDLKTTLLHLQQTITASLPPSLVRQPRNTPTPLPHRNRRTPPVLLHHHSPSSPRRPLVGRDPWLTFKSAPLCPGQHPSPLLPSSRSSPQVATPPHFLLEHV